MKQKIEQKEKKLKKKKKGRTNLAAAHQGVANTSPAQLTSSPG
jgi:hypothetical protein